MWSVDSSTDYDTLVRDGVVENNSDYSNLMDLCTKLQTHDCTKANRRCMKRKASDDTFICRVPRHPPSFQYTFEERTGLYDDDTLRRLEYLDLAATCELCGDHWNVDAAFKGGMWHYPAYRDEHFSPTVPRLFAMLQSSTNVQVCDRKFQVSYLAKYAAGQEENKSVSFTQAEKRDELTVNARDMINVKISGQALHPLNNRDGSLAREIALTELIWYCFKFTYVISSCDFVHASTKPPEYRAVIVKNTAVNRIPVHVDGGGGLPLTVTQRLPLPNWRQFTDNQITTIAGYEVGRHYLDRTSSFSVRPPELRMITQLEMYLRWFVWGSDRKAKIQIPLQQSNWIDGAKRCVRIRYAHIPDVAQYIFNLRTSRDPNLGAAATELFAFIVGPLYVQYRNGLHNDENDLFTLFVDLSCSRQNVVVFPSPTPSYLSNFLIHVLLTFGEYVCEADLYSNRTITHAYRRAGLFRGLS